MTNRRHLLNLLKANQHLDPVILDILQTRYQQECKSTRNKWAQRWVLRAMKQPGANTGVLAFIYVGLG